MLNHSYTDRQVRLALQVRSAIGSDLERALRLIVEVARGASARAAPSRRPWRWSAGFADSGIDLECGFWIAIRRTAPSWSAPTSTAKSGGRFGAEGIEIPYPHREIRVTADSALRQR